MKYLHLIAFMLVIIPFTAGAQNNSSDTTTAKNNDKKSAVRFFAGPGVSMASIHYSKFPVGTTLKEHKAGFGPKLALGIDAPVNPNTGNLIFRLELSAALNDLKATVTQQPIATDIFTTNYQTIKQFQGSLRPQVLYNFYNSDSFKFYLGTGVAINVASYSKNELYRVNVSPVPNYNSQTTITNFSDLSSASFAYLVKAGFGIGNNVDLSFGYAYCKLGSNPIPVQADLYTNAFEFGINYKFGR